LQPVEASVKVAEESSLPPIDGAQAAEGADNSSAKVIAAEELNATQDCDDRLYKTVDDIHEVGNVKQAFDVIVDETIKDLKDYVVATWSMKADENKQRSVYTQMGLYVVRAGENARWGATTMMGKLSRKGWYMLQIYNLLRLFYVVAYKNVSPFVVLILSSYYLVFQD